MELWESGGGVGEVWMLGMGWVGLLEEKRSVKYSECVCQLVRCSGIGTIWILQDTDLVFSVSLNDRTVEEISVPIPFNCLGFFDTLDMIGFFLS
jgi:hypothetical protein